MNSTFTIRRDNTVLAQQTAKFLIGSISKVMQGKELKGSVKYLENIASILQSQLLVIDKEDLLKTEVQVFM